MEIAIRTTSDPSEANDWAFVLEATGIAHRLEPGDAGWTLVVLAPDASRASAEIDAYAEEARGEPEGAVDEPAAHETGWTTGLLVALLLLGSFAVTGTPGAGSRWFARGAASAGAIVNGEAWRTVTALTLHLDAVHVASNAVATAVLLPPLVQRLGAGVGLWLMLVAGTAANLLGALAHDPRHVAVGASTATFGAIGILAALRLVGPPAATVRRWKPWLVVATALLLLAMLGAGRGSDVLAHGLGVASGAVLGLVAGAVLRHPPRSSVQAVLAVLSAAMVAAAWRIALTGSVW
jgi:membrane associated rhomboid family serine protease